MSSPTLSRPSESTSAGIWRRGSVAVVIGAIAAALYGWVIDLAGVPMLAGGPGATEPEAVGPANFAAGTAALSLVGVGIAAVLLRRAAAPRRTFIVTTVALVALSFVPVVLAGATATSTKLAFALGHVLLATLVVSLIARALPIDQPAPSRNRVRVMP